MSDGDESKGPTLTSVAPAERVLAAAHEEWVAHETALRDAQAAQAVCDALVEQLQRVRTELGPLQRCATVAAHIAAVLGAAAGEVVSRAASLPSRVHKLEGRARIAARAAALHVCFTRDRALRARRHCDQAQERLDEAAAQRRRELDALLAAHVTSVSCGALEVVFPGMPGDRQGHLASGRGLRATRAIAKGTVLLQEKALVGNRLAQRSTEDDKADRLTSFEFEAIRRQCVAMVANSWSPISAILDTLLAAAEDDVVAALLEALLDQRYVGAGGVQRGGAEGSAEAAVRELGGQAALNLAVAISDMEFCTTLLVRSHGHTAPFSSLAELTDQMSLGAGWTHDDNNNKDRPMLTHCHVRTLFAATCLAAHSCVRKERNATSFVTQHTSKKRQQGSSSSSRGRREAETCLRSVMVATRDIAAGEEILINYGTQHHMVAYGHCRCSACAAGVAPVSMLQQAEDTSEEVGPAVVAALHHQQLGRAVRKRMNKGFGSGGWEAFVCSPGAQSALGAVLATLLLVVNQDQIPPPQPLADVVQAAVRVPPSIWQRFLGADAAARISSERVLKALETLAAPTVHATQQRVRDALRALME